MEKSLCPLCGNGGSAREFWLGPRDMVRCRRCRLVFRHPRPADLDVSAEAGEARVETVEEEWLGARRGMNFRRFLDRWAGTPGQLLDVGCGHGRFLAMARDRGWEVTGIDVSPAAVRYAREGFGVPAMCGDLKGFRFPDHAFTLVTLWDVLDFVPDPIGLLQEIHRVLEPGGRLFIRVPNYLFQRVSYLLTAWAARTRDLTFVFHVASFAPGPLRLLLGRTGFVAVTIANSPPTWGDPYRAFGGAERLIAALKVGVYGLVQGLYRLSGGRWVLGPSLEVHARREG